MPNEQIRPEDILSPEVVKAFTKLKDEVALLTTELTKLMTAFTKSNEELKNGVTTNKQLADNVKMVETNSKKLNDVEKEEEKIRRAYNSAVAKEIALKDEKNKKLIAETAELKKNNLEHENAAKGVNGVSEAERKRYGNIGKYKEDIVKAYVAISAAIGAGSAVMEFFKRTINSTNATAEEFEFRMAAAKGALDGALRTIANGEWGKFFSNMKQGAIDARNLAEAMDFYDHTLLANKVLTADELEKTNELQATYKLTTNSLKDRTAAMNGYIEIVKGAAKRNVDAETAINDALVEEFRNRTNLTDEQLKQSVTIYATNTKALQVTEEITKAEDELRKKRAESEEASAKAGFKSDTRGIGTDIIKRIELLKEENRILLANTGLTTEEIQQLMIVNKYMNPEEIKKLGESYTRLGQAKSQANEVDKETAKIRGTLVKEEIKDDKKLYDEKEKLSNTWDDNLKTRLAAENKSRELAVKNFEETEAEKVKAREYANGLMDEADRILYEEEKKRQDKAVEDAKRAEEEKTNLKYDSINALFDLGNAIGNNQISQLENQKEKELKAAGDNAKKKEKIEADYNKKVGEIRRNQAIADKVQALFNIGINTAQAITKATAQLGAFGIPVITWIKILGGLQAAAVLAAPLPKFYKGVRNFKGGLAEVGEKGTELIETKSGMFLTPDKATKMLLPAGSNVYTHEKTIEKLQEMDSSRVDVLIKEQRLTRKALANQQHRSTEITADGWIETTRKANSRTTHIDKYFRN